MSVLVDSSVWIDFFRYGKNEQLNILLSEDIVVTNQIILSELLPSLQTKRKHEIIESLENLQIIYLQIDWELIRKYQVLNLKNGINKVGLPDLIILQQVIESNLTLYSLDKHFKLMRGYLSFNLLD
ncbi:MAG: PIN domain-containing protein [Bacteroidota bacterium]